MGIYENLIRFKEQQNLLQEEAADQLLMYGENSPALVDELNSMKSALEMLLSGFQMEMNSILGCESVEELIESTLDSMGVMCEAIDVSHRDFSKSSDIILAQNETGRAVVLIPSLFGYMCINADNKHRYLLTKKVRLRSRAYIVHRPVPISSNSTKGILLLILQLITPRDILAILVSTLLASLLGTILPYLNGWALNTLLPMGSSAYAALVYGLVLYITVGIFRACFEALKSKFLSGMRLRISVQVQAALMAKVLMEHHSYFSQSVTGRISTKIRSGQQLAEKIIDVSLDTSFTVIFSIVYLPQMLTYGSTLCMPALIMLLVKIGISVISFISCMRNQAASLENDIAMNGFLFSAIRGIQRIKSLNAESRIYSKWASLYKTRIRLKLNPPLSMKLRGVLISFVTDVCTVLLLSISAKTGISRENYIAFNAAYALVLAAFSQLINTTEAIFMIRPLLDQVDSLFTSRLSLPVGKKYVRSLKGKISLVNVGYSYGNSVHGSLSDINLTIRPGEKVAIVGESGSGKTTLLKLLLGLIVPDTGSIYYDDFNINSLNLRSLRKKIGSVMQFSGLIPGTIYQNILLGTNGSVSMDDAWEAAEKAVIADDIRAMSLKMETEVSEGKVGGLSGGQRQRLLIARALASKKSVLFLDEATSALDNITQKKVLDNLFQEKHTVVMVAHRLSTVIHCDRIVVIEKGRIVEQGTYDELIAKNGVFAQLVSKQ